MIRKIKSPGPQILSFSLSETVTMDDYEQVLLPEMEAALEEGPLRLVILAEDDFNGFSKGTLVDDLRFLIFHRDDIARLALVSDSSAMRLGAHLLTPFVPFEVKIFHRNELHAAGDWCGLSGTQKIHSFNRKQGIITIKPRGELDPRQLEMIRVDMDQYLKEHSNLSGILLDVEHFPGWQNLAALASHLRLVKDHHARIRRLAVLTDDKVLGNIPKLAELFLDTEIIAFDPKDRKIAREWLQAPS